MFRFVSPLLLGVAPLFVLAACSDDHFPGGDGAQASEIAFGIRQESGADGKTTTTGEYEFLSLAHQGGWVTEVFRDGDGDGVCYFERFDHRIGKPRVESGAASFTGGELPPSGLQILANQPDATTAAAGWKTGDQLSFQVSGFAMPPVRPVTMPAPPTSVTITSISPAPPPPPPLPADATPLALKPTDDVRVAWTPLADSQSHSHSHIDVMVALVTEEDNDAGGEVRCFADADDTSAVIPSLWVARLFSSVDAASAIKGHLLIASHRQATVRARSDWTVYVVATALQRDVAFTGSR